MKVDFSYQKTKHPIHFYLHGLPLIFNCLLKIGRLNCKFIYFSSYSNQLKSNTIFNIHNGDRVKGYGGTWYDYAF